MRVEIWDMQKKKIKTCGTNGRKLSLIFSFEIGLDVGKVLESLKPVKVGSYAVASFARQVRQLRWQTYGCFCSYGKIMAC